MPTFIEGFEGNSWTNVELAGWAVDAFVTISVTATGAHQDLEGRGSSYSLYLQGGNGSGVLSPLVPNNSRWLNFYRKRSTSSLGGGFYGYGVTFYKAGAIQFAVRVNSGNYIELLRGGAFGTLVATSAQAITSLMVPHWISIEFVADDSVGVCNVYVDNVLMVSYSGDTQEQATSGWDKFKFIDSDQWSYIDDVVITTSAEGRAQETYVVALSPDSDDVIASTSSGGGTGTYTNVDEIPLEATNYNEFVSGSQDTYGVANLSFTPTTIYGEKVSLYASRDGAVTQVQAVVSSSNSLVTGSLQSIAASATYTVIEEIFSQDPATSAAWTASGINSQKIGARFA